MKQILNRHIILAALLSATPAAVAQGLNSGYFTSGYLMGHTLNPAYGYDQNYVSLPYLGNINVNLQGNFGYEDVVFHNPSYGTSSDKKMTTFMHPDISVADALSGFSRGDNRILADVSLALLSAGFKSFGGYNTIELNSRSNVGVSLPYELFEFAKNTGNKNYEFGDMNAHAQTYVELAFGHSRDINEKIRIGAKLKLLFGLGRADVTLKNVTANLQAENQWIVSGQATADASIKGFRYISEETEYNAHDGTYEHVSDVDVDGLKMNGMGLAADLGIVYKINENWTLNAALLDLGFLHWKQNHRAVNATDEFVFEGFHDFHLNNDEGDDTFEDQWDCYTDQMVDFANLKDTGKSSGRTTGIGTTVNIGASYNLPAYRKLTFGLLSSTRINGKYSWTQGRVSANWAPLKWLDGGVNLAVSTYGTSMGWIVNLHPKGFNLFVGMDRLLGKVSNEFIPLNSRASASVGMSIEW